MLSLKTLQNDFWDIKKTFLKKRSTAPFYGWGSTTSKARATLRRQFTFYH